MTNKLLVRENGLQNQTIDPGSGDFEAALGGASPTLGRDVVEMWLARCARPQRSSHDVLVAFHLFNGNVTPSLSCDQDRS